jgi:hypothetical protein
LNPRAAIHAREPQAAVRSQNFTTGRKLSNSRRPGTAGPDAPDWDCHTRQSGLFGYGNTQVRSETSSFVFKGKPRNIHEAKQLEADYILEAPSCVKEGSCGSMTTRRIFSGTTHRQGRMRKEVRRPQKLR